MPPSSSKPSPSRWAKPSSAATSRPRRSKRSAGVGPAVAGERPGGQQRRTATLSALARKVEAEPDRDERIHRLVELAVYWDKLCSADRAKASPEAVRAVARLLRLGPPRWLIIDMLSDVGPNLRSAAPELGPAIRDERRRDAEYLRQSRPFVPTNYRVAVDQLRCLQHKARSGRTDAPQCRLLLAVKAAERG